MTIGDEGGYRKLSLKQNVFTDLCNIEAHAYVPLARINPWGLCTEIFLHFACKAYGFEIWVSGLGFQV
jgi:hypothetical protein